MKNVEFFEAELAFRTDVSDVHAGLHATLHDAAGSEFVLVDSRGSAAWAQGHIPGAIHLPTAEIARRAPAELDRAVPVVTCCWGPGCNGATRAALEFARLGFEVREMIGGYEYWVREGFAGRPADPLTVPLDTPGCGC
jgi:rhodanese-related sulfurtransferase